MVFQNLKHFKPSEFMCKCQCGANDMKPVFLWKLEQARELAGIPFIIRSGYRCSKHNKEVGGKPTSDHLTGEGVDVESLTSWHRFKIVSSALMVGITRIGIGDTYTHLGDGRHNPRSVIWTYY